MIRRLIPVLMDFLRAPEIHITVTPSDEVQQLRSDLDAANQTIKQLRTDLNRMEGKFVMSSELNLMYMDLLNQHGIKHRHIREGDLWKK